MVAGAAAGEGPSPLVLIVEDEADFCRMVRYRLEAEGYRVRCVGSGPRAVALARELKPSVILLDVMLPGADGFTVCRRLRRHLATPILFLSARKSTADRIMGLRTGGDDYLGKPFSMGELLARIEALLRRASSRREAGGGRDRRAVLRRGPLAIDPARREARLRGRRLSLTPKEFDLLFHLATADEKVLKREVLLRKVWGHGEGIEVDTRTVDQHVARLRRKLGPARDSLLTVPCVGYRLVL